MKLGKDVFLALTTIAWADGQVLPVEAAALMRAAKASGLTGADLAALEQATRAPIALKDVATLHLGGDERLYVYCIAAWLASVDGSVDPRERAAMKVLGDRLQLDEEERERAASASHLVAQFSDQELHAQGLIGLAQEIERNAAEESS